MSSDQRCLPSPNPSSGRGRPLLSSCMSRKFAGQGSCGRPAHQGRLFDRVKATQPDHLPFINDTSAPTASPSTKRHTLNSRCIVFRSFSVHEVVGMRTFAEIGPRVVSTIIVFMVN